MLFTDAARIDLGRVRRDHDLPVRMLIVGLPLAILPARWTAACCSRRFRFGKRRCSRRLLAPTDAALGQAVVSARIVPLRIRQAINVESGLNDGIALPAVLLFAALAVGEQGGNDASRLGAVRAVSSSCSGR